MEQKIKLIEDIFYQTYLKQRNLFYTYLDYLSLNVVFMKQRVESFFST